MAVLRLRRGTRRGRPSAKRVQAMDMEQATEIIECLPKGRTIFHYFKDRYALELLSYHVGAGKPVAEVKRSRYGRLLR